MTERIALGTPVHVSSKYGPHAGRNDLVVLSDEITGYGVGPKGNDPAKSHNGAEGWLYYGSNSQVTPKKESKVTQFKAGDKVRITNSTGTTISSWIGVEGIVKGNGLYYTHTTLELTTSPNESFPVGSKANISTAKLELIEEPSFTFKDIQKGDTIRRTRTFKDGATEAREGVVSSKGSYYWATEDGNYILAYDTDDKNEQVALELVSRPEPEPTLLANTKAGDQLVLNKTSGYVKLYNKVTEDKWRAFIIPPHGDAYKGSTWTTEELEQFAADSGTKSYTLIRA